MNARLCFSRFALASSFALAGCGPAPTPAVKAPAPPARPVTSARATAPVAALPPDPEPWRSQRPASGEAAAISFPVPEHVTLANGLNVYLVHKPVPVVSIELTFRRGASACPAGKSGLASFTARMLTEGTKAHAGLALAEQVEALGTTLAADAGRDSSTLSLSALSADLGKALALLAEVVEQPRFSAEDFGRVRAEWLDGLRAERQTPSRLASLAALRLLLGEPHGSPADGSLTDIAKLTLDDVKSFHAHTYRALDGALVVVGDTTLEKVRELAERSFAKLRGSAKDEPAAAKKLAEPAWLDQPFSLPAAPEANQVWIIDRPAAVQSAITLLQSLPKRSQPGFESREILSKILGGLFTSRLNTNLREEHAYTYGAHAQALATRHWGAFYVTTSVRTDVTALALKEALSELGKAKDASLGKPITPEELGRARADLVQSLGARLEYGARIAASVSELFSSNLAPDYFHRYAGLLTLENVSRVNDVARALDPTRMVMVIVGDRSAIEPPLRQAGFKVVAAPVQLTD